MDVPAHKNEFIDRFVEVCGTSEPVKIQRLLDVSYQAAKNYLLGRMPDSFVLRTITERTPYSINWLLTGQGEKLIAAARDDADSRQSEFTDDSESRSDAFVQRFIEVCGASEPADIRRFLGVSLNLAKLYLDGGLPSAPVLRTISEKTPYSINWLLTGKGGKLRAVASNNEARTITTRFADFPSEVSSACEQYLLYFTEFLRQVGISASANLTHEAGEVLFSITPDDPTDALDKIRKALDVFLSLPRGNVVIVEDEDMDLAVLKTKANIEHLHSQLSLARAEINLRERELKAYEATVEAKDISIDLLTDRLKRRQQLLDGNIKESIIEVDAIPTEEKEEFFDGILALTKYNEKGLQIDLAKLFRKLREFMKR